MLARLLRDAIDCGLRESFHDVDEVDDVEPEGLHGDVRHDGHDVAINVRDFGGSGPLALLHHANGFAAGTWALVARELEPETLALLHRRPVVMSDACHVSPRTGVNSLPSLFRAAKQLSTTADPCGPSHSTLRLFLIRF